VRLATEEINKAGGVLGKKIQLIERDDEAKNERGVQIAQELINKEQVVATVGFINTGVAQAAQRFYQEAKIPVMNNVATGSILTQQFKAPEFTENYIFRNAAHDSIQAPMIVEEAVVRRGFKKVAILADSTNYGQLGLADLERALGTKNIKAVAVEKFNIKDIDMTAQLLKAKEAGAEVILTYGIGPELAQIANGMTKLGWKVPMIGSWTLSMANFIDNAGQGGQGARMPQTFIQEPNTVKRKAFIDAYLKTFKPKNNRIDSPVSASQAYDSIYLLTAAIKQAGSTNGVKIKEALENLQTKVEGVVTVYDHPYTKDDHEAITANIPVFGEVKNGRVVYAYQEDQDKGADLRLKKAATAKK
jgi:branched-chain amino acid transport system substrate-binding protein